MSSILPSGGSLILPLSSFISSFVDACPLCSASVCRLRPSNRDRRFARGISGPRTVPSDVTEGVGDGSALTPPTESGESEPSEVFDSEEPEVSSEAGTEGTSSLGVGGPRYEDKLEETYEDSPSDVDDSEGEESDLKLWVGECSSSTSIGPRSTRCSVPTRE